MKLRYNYLLLLALIILFACKGQKETGPETTTQVDPYLSRFDDFIEKIEAEDKENPPPKDGAVFIGSSSFRMWRTIKEDLAPYPVINRGFGGSTMPQAIHYMDRIVFPYQPKCIFVYEGDNDIISPEVSPDSVLTTVKTFMKKVKEKAPQAQVYFVSVKPSIARRSLLGKAQETNQLVADYAVNEEQLTYIDVANPVIEDGKIRSDIFIQDSLHMNATGYAIWTEVIKPYVAGEFEE